MKMFSPLFLRLADIIVPENPEFSWRLDDSVGDAKGAAAETAHSLKQQLDDSVGDADGGGGSF